MKLPKFTLAGIEPQAQEAFKLLQTFFQSIELFKFDWKFIQFSVPGAVTHYAIPHRLGYVPADILVTQANGAITFHYADFTDTLLYITTTGAVDFRGLVGKYRGSI